MAQASRKYDVPLSVLYAVAMTESGDGGELHPFALNIEGRPYLAPTFEDALRRFAAAKSEGARLIDVGCMQINHHFHGAQFASVGEMFGAHENVDYGARFLKRLREQEGSWTLAAARYHAGPGNVPAQKHYVCQVAANMVRSGFGAWTEGAKAFCR
ncbi:transglycosylase SLT domain-containing protein [Methylocella sp.]|uniref:transglycosylase SLT domain-containing protein n=1 Tax=Methylocella sp. TaxID=1978226 RepID=UPI0037831967